MFESPILLQIPMFECPKIMVECLNLLQLHMFESPSFNFVRIAIMFKSLLCYKFEVRILKVEQIHLNFWHHLHPQISTKMKWSFLLRRVPLLRVFWSPLKNKKLDRFCPLPRKISNSLDRFCGWDFVIWPLRFWRNTHLKAFSTIWPPEKVFQMSIHGFLKDWPFQSYYLYFCLFNSKHIFII